MASVDLILRQRRYTQTSSGVTKYKIELSATPGGTPTHTPAITTQVFVMTLKTAVADDTFARVATIADLDLVVGQRYVAVENSVTEYRTTNVTLSFDDLDTGVAAIPVIKDRVNSLVSAWNTSKTDFVHTGKDYNLPEATTASSVEAAAITAWKDAKTARTDAEAEQATCQTAYTDAQKDAAEKLALRDFHNGYLADWNSVDGLTETAVTGLSNAKEALITASVHITRTTNISITGAATSANSDTTVVDAGNPFGGVTLGDLVAVTLAVSGKKEVRTISVVAAGQLTVHQAFTTAPQTADLWEVRKLSDFLPSNDFGSTSSAADAAISAYADASKVTGLLTTVEDARVATQAAYDVAVVTYNTAVTAENAELSSLNDCKASKDVAQTAENAMLADLQAVCPDKDVATL